MKRLPILFLSVILTFPLFAEGPGGGQGGPGNSGGPKQPSPPPAAPVPPSPDSQKPAPPPPPSQNFRPGPEDGDTPYMNYRGHRKFFTDAPLEMEHAGVRVDGTNLEIELIFNQSVNPASFKIENFYVNGVKYEGSYDFRFNRNGDVVKIKLPGFLENQDIFLPEVSFVLKNISSVDGKLLEEIEFTGKKPAIHPKKTKEPKEPWQKF